VAAPLVQTTSLAAPIINSGTAIPVAAVGPATTFAISSHNSTSNAHTSLSPFTSTNLNGQRILSRKQGRCIIRPTKMAGRRGHITRMSVPTERVFGRNYRHPDFKSSAPLALKKALPRLEGYEPDGSLRFKTERPALSPTITTSSKNDFMLSPRTGGPKVQPKFTIFGKFPLEIRLKIWEMALPSDRIIRIVKNDVTNVLGLGLHEDGSPRSTYRALTSNPGVLGACSESRNLSRKHYKLSFAHRLFERPIYFDRTRDIVFFEDTETLNRFTGHPFRFAGRRTKKVLGDIGHIQHIIVGDMAESLTVKLLGLYKGLKVITFEEQVLNLNQARVRLDDREAMIKDILGKPKNEGGAGHMGCAVSFESKFLLRLISWNPAWRIGMLDL
jgi:hypothetical protein